MEESAIQRVERHKKHLSEMIKKSTKYANEGSEDEDKEEVEGVEDYGMKIQPKKNNLKKIERKISASSISSSHLTE